MKWHPHARTISCRNGPSPEGLSILTLRLFWGILQFFAVICALIEHGLIVKSVADTGFSQTGGVSLLLGLKNEVQFGHKRTLILTGFYSV